MEGYEEFSTADLEAAARAADQEALTKAEGLVHEGSEFWRRVWTAASIRLVLLSREPGDANALRRLYELVKKQSFDPPAAGEVLPRVAEHYRRLTARHPEDPSVHLRLAIALNVEGGMPDRYGYPGAEPLARALELDRRDPEICVEMGTRCFHTPPADGGGHARARRWFESALDLDPTFSYAYSALAELLMDGDDTPLEAAILMATAYRHDPENLFAAAFLHAVGAL